MYTFDLLPNAILNVTQLERWFSPVEALRAVTSSAGRWLTMTGPKNPWKAGPIGVIEEGAYADLILVDGDPLQSTEVLVDNGNVDLVMISGAVHKNEMN